MYRDILHLQRIRKALFALLLVSALLSSGSQTHGCVHDRIFAKQLARRSIGEALAEGRFRAHAIVEVPRSDPSRAAATDSSWQPIRIAVYAEDVEDPSKHCTAAGQLRPDFEGGRIRCTPEDILTPEKKALLLDTMIPRAIKMHQDRLSVRPLLRITIGESLVGPICGSFTAPAAVEANGVRDVDFVLFVAAGPITGNTVAWATTCGFGTGNRPLIGAMSIKPRYIDGSEQSIRTIAHEIMHALGFSSSFFRASLMLSTDDTLRSTPPALMLVSAGVVQRAGNQYNCSALPGVELDNSGGEGTAGSHWSLRNARHEIMCGYVGPAMKYTALSIAAMEDLGFYRGNYSNAEHMEWGFNAGCGLLNEKCVKDGVSQVPSLFCDDKRGSYGAPSCTADRTAIGYCNVRRHVANIPSYFQYFSDPLLGGLYAADYCPYVEGDAATRCSDGYSSVMANSLRGPGSRCVDTAARSVLTQPICLGFACDTTAQTYMVTFLNASSPVDCPEGTTIDAYTSSPTIFTPGSTIVCPPYRSVCPSTFNSLAIRVVLRQSGGSDGVCRVACRATAILVMLAVLAHLFVA